MIFYVYSILDSRKPGNYRYNDLEFSYEPIYIGKGKKNRLNDHLKTRALRKNSFKNNKIKNILKENLKPMIIKLKENLSENDALSFEKEYISKIGRYPNGPLTNLTNGGDGVSGLKHSQDSLQKMSKTWFSKDYVSWNKDKIMTEEHCKNLSIVHIGKTLLSETKAKLSVVRKDIKKSKDHKIKIKESLCKKTYKFTSPENQEFLVKNYKEFAKLHDLSIGNVCSLLQGKRKHCKGWTGEIVK
jgi:hypothetical protein